MLWEGPPWLWGLVGVGQARPTATSLGGNHRPPLSKSSTLFFPPFPLLSKYPQGLASPVTSFHIPDLLGHHLERICVSVCHTYFFSWGLLLHHYLNHCCVKFHASFDLYFRPGYAVYLPLTLVPWCYCQGNPAQRPFPFPPPSCPFLFNFFLSSFFFFCLLTWFS